MRVIYTNNERRDCGFLSCASITHEESADVNLISVEMPLNLSGTLQNGSYIYDEENREFGGKITRYDDVDTAAQTVTFGGYTWRGLLATRIVSPPEGEAHLIYLSADEKTTSDIVSELLNACEFDSVFEVEQTTDSGVAIQFDRYCTLLAALEKLYSAADCRMKLEYYPESGKIKISGQLHGSVEEFDSIKTDMKVSFNMLPITHLICLGSGELENRMVEHLYLQADGSIGENRFYTGSAENEKTFELSNAESREVLIDSGKAHFLELLSATTTVALVIPESSELCLGDTVAGTENTTRISIVQKITRKVVNISIGSRFDDVVVTKSYETGEI